MIFPGSRYEGVPIVPVTAKNGRPAKYLELRERVTEDDIEPDVRIYSVENGDTLDLIASKFGLPTRLWWLIADVNDIADPFSLTVGQELIIPGTTDFAKR